jgi:hypothetical protein
MTWLIVSVVLLAIQIVLCTTGVYGDDEDS